MTWALWEKRKARQSLVLRRRKLPATGQPTAQQAPATHVSTRDYSFGPRLRLSHQLPADPAEVTTAIAATTMSRADGSDPEFMPLSTSPLAGTISATGTRVGKEVRVG